MQAPGSLSIEVMMSPIRIPALAAGPPATTAATLRP